MESKESRHKLPVALFCHGITRTALNSPAMTCDSACKVLPTRKFTQAWVFRMLIGGQSCKHGVTLAIQSPAQKSN